MAPCHHIGIPDWSDCQASPTFPPPQPTGLSPVLERNIRSLQERRQREESEATMQEKIAEAITRFTGSMLFVYIHLALFGFWIIANLGWVPGVPKWDESFVVLAMWASVEAIFLSTFVLISQNRMQAASDKRADLDLQISLWRSTRSPSSQLWSRPWRTRWASARTPMPSWRRSCRTLP